MARIVVDAGHGGSDFGAVYQGRREKDDNLRLALAVGEILKDRGQEVIYTRTEDIYQTPAEKAAFANSREADYLVSIHRNSSPVPGQYEGVETLVYDDEGIKADMARRIDRELARVGFRDIGVSERKNLAVLRRSRMPAVLVEAGFINSDADNRRFDENFDKIAQGIADGILQAIDGQERTHTAKEGAAAVSEAESAKASVYRVQTGAYTRWQNGEALLTQMQQQGFPAYMVSDGGLYKVMAGEYENMENAVKLEKVLRKHGYPTLIVGSCGQGCSE